MSFMYIKSAFAAQVVLLLAQASAFPQGESSAKMILELPPADTISVPAEEIVRRCSEILANREKHSPETVATVLSCRGDTYCRLRLFDDALKDFDALCELQPRDSKAKCARALALVYLGRNADAADEAKAAIAIDPKSASSYTTFSYVLYMQGKLVDAAASAQQAINIDQEYAKAYYVRARIKFAQGDANECLVMVNRYFESGPFPGLAEPGHPYWLRGSALYDLCRPREALNNFLMARNLSPSSLAPADAVFATYSNLGKWNMAARAGEKVVLLSPDSVRSHVFCAFAQARIGKKAASLKMLDKAWSIVAPIGESPAVQATILGYAGKVHFHVGQYAKASEFLEDALEIDEHCDAALCGKAIMLACCADAKYRNGPEALKIAEGIHEREKRLKRDERHQFRIHELLADAHAECGNYAEAITSARKAIELAGPDREHGEFQARIKLFEKKTAYRYAPAIE